MGRDMKMLRIFGRMDSLKELTFVFSIKTSGGLLATHVASTLVIAWGGVHLPAFSLTPFSEIHFKVVPQ